MTFKKLLLFVSLTLGAIAISVPASASALEWTDNGAAFEGEAADVLTGNISFGNPAPGQTKFGCTVHADLLAHGGTTTSTVVSFTPTTETCEGEGLFEGCQLVEDETTGLSADVQTTGTNTLTVAGPIVIHTVLDPICPIEKMTWTVQDLSITSTNSDLTDATVSGLAQSHSQIRGGGEVTQTIALFGTLHTETDTLTIK